MCLYDTRLVYLLKGVMGVAKEKTHAAIEKLAWEFLIAPAANFKQQIWVSLLDITLSLLCNIS